MASLHQLMSSSSSSLHSLSQLSSIIFLCICLLSSVATQSPGEPNLPHHGRCEKITIDLCKDIAYNETIMPNLLNHAKQEEAGSEIHSFAPLVKVQCSRHLQLFLCTMYVPVCTILDKAIPPCRSLCESARRDCEGIITKFGYKWPDNLNCEKLPEFFENNLCVGPESLDSNRDGHGHVSPSGHSMGSNSYGSTFSFPGTLNTNNPSGSYSLSGRPRVNNNSRDLRFKCPAQFRTPFGLDYHLKIRGMDSENCGAPCDGVFLTRQERSTIKVWNAIWSTICVASTSFIILTFLIDRHRFKYPERPIIYMSLCHLAIGLVYLFGSFMGDKVACNKPFPPPNSGASSLQNIEMVETVTQGNKKESCTFFFMSLYFSTIANSVWWVILTVTWFLAAGLKWTQEAIEAYSHYCHLVGWALPAALTITVLAMGKIEGDSLSGVCYVGFWNQEAINSFVIIPVMICLIIGFLFLLFGFISLWNIRTLMKMESTTTDKLERLMLRIVFFSILYILPTFLLLFCYHYEQKNLDKWVLSWLMDVCQKREYGIPCPPVADDVRSNHIFISFLFKYLFTLLAGITTSGFWVLSEKTLHTWGQFYNRMYHRLCCVVHIEEDHV